MKTEFDPHPELLKLLALKRYEQPPPGYFEDFSGRVLARLETGPMVPEPNAWQAFWSRFELHPMWGSLAACGLVVCAASFFQVLGGEAVPTWVDSLQIGMLPALGYQGAMSRTFETPVETTPSSISAVLPGSSSGLRVDGLLHKASYSSY
jgi:hypothetical protein